MCLIHLLQNFVGINRGTYCQEAIILGTEIRTGEASIKRPGASPLKGHNNKLLEMDFRSTKSDLEFL